MLDIHATMRKLVAQRPLFYGEANFQHNLALILQEDFKVELEDRLRPEEKANIDIYLPNEGIGIELKYPTDDFKREGYGRVFSSGEQEAACYRFWADVERLEGWVKDDILVTGFAVLLTNKSSMWKEPRGPSRFDEVRVFEGRRGVTGALNVYTKADAKTTYKQLHLHGQYDVYWLEYFDHNERRGRFRYLVVHV